MRRIKVFSLSVLVVLAALSVRAEEGEVDLLEPQSDLTTMPGYFHPDVFLPEGFIPLIFDPSCSRLNDLIFGDCVSERTGLHVSGWIDQGFTWNPSNPQDRLNGPMLPNDRSNDYQLNEVYLIAERRLNANSCEGSIGGRIDVLYGTDAFVFQSLGLDDQTVSSDDSRFYKLAFPQLYASAQLPGLDGVTLQAGKLLALVGYDFLPPYNFFYSVSMYNFTTPATYTGALGTFQLTENWVTQQGIARGWNVWDDNNKDWSYLGTVQWARPETGSWIYFAWMIGPEDDDTLDSKNLNGIPIFPPGGGFDPAGIDAPGESLNRSIFALFVNQAFSEELNYTFVCGGGEQEGSQAVGIPDCQWYWIVNYLTYQFSEKLAAGARVEWLRDDDGLFVTAPRSPTLPVPGNYYEITLGLNWKPQPCVRVRPEVRWDWQRRTDAANPPAYDDRTATSQFLASFDVIVTF